MESYTVFCREYDNFGTTWIEHIEAETPFKAAEVAKRRCAEDWGWVEDEGWENRIVVQGVLRGEVTVEFWND